MSSALNDESGKKSSTIRCYVNQRLSPMMVVKEMVSLGMLDAPASQRWFVEQCFEADFASSHLSGASPPSRQSLGDALYFKSLLHKLAKELSGDGRDMDDVMAEAMIRADDLAASLERTDPESRGWLHKAYFLGGPDCLTRRASGTIYIRSHTNMFAGSTGCFEWDAGYLLCEFILNNASIFQDRVIVELGCGTGMVTVMVAKLKLAGALTCGPIVCTDGDQDTLDNCRGNLVANGIDVDDDDHIMCSTWMWEDGYVGLGERERQALESGRPVTVVGADLLYDPEIIPVIVPLMAEFLEKVPADSCVYLSTRRRSEDTLAKFLRAVEEAPTLILEDVSDVFWDASRHDPSFVSFQHVRSLDEAKRSQCIILHRISLV